MELFYSEDEDLNLYKKSVIYRGGSKHMKPIKGIIMTNFYSTSELSMGYNSVWVHCVLLTLLHSSHVIVKTQK